MQGNSNSSASSRTRRLAGVIGAVGLIVALTSLSSAMAQTAAPTAVPTAAPTIMPTAASTTVSVLAPRPVIHASVNGTPLAGALGSYCWPPAAGSNQPPCALIDNPQPINFSPVNTADQVTFTVDPVAGQSATLTAALPNDLDAAGQPIVVNLQATQGVYTIAHIGSGDHRLIVQAAYPPDADGNQNYVEYVFDLRIGGSNAGSTGIALLPTGLGTAAATGLSTAISTKMVTAAAPLQTAAATMLATGVANITSPTTLSTVNATHAVTGTPLQKTPATPLHKTATSAPTLAVSPSPTATLVSVTTSTPIQPTVPPIATIGASAIATTVTSGLSATTTPMLIEGLPALTINFNGISYQPIALTFAQLDANGALHIVTHPVNATPSILKAQSGTLVTISFAGPSPLSELFTLTTADDTQTVSQALVPAGSSVSYTLPTQPGLYNLHVALHWTGSNPLTSQATYVFRLQIGS